MYDLDTLAVMNNPRLARKQPANPREILVEKLRSLAAPPAIMWLVGRMGDYEDFGDFIALIQEFIPEHEREILNILAPSDQMAAFASYFEDRYFPLHDAVRGGEFERYRNLTSNVPAIIRGMDWEDYAEIPEAGIRPGAQLLTWLFDSSFNQELDERAALFEACKEHVPQRLLKKVPHHGGFRNEDVKRILAGTKYEQAIKWSDYINNNTDNYFLDTDMETFSAGYQPDWAKETIEHLTVKWHEVEQHDRDTDEFFEWLEEKPPARFKELLEFMLDATRE